MSAVTYGPTRRYGASDRAISYAVLFSLLLHGALLFSFSMRPSSSRPPAPGPIVAHLVSPPPPAPVPPAPQPEPPRPHVEQPPPPPAMKPAPKPRPAPTPKAAAPSPRPLPPPAPAPSAPSAASTPPQASAPAQPSAPSALARAEPQPAAPSNAEADALQAYRSELIEWAKKYKRYPRVAMDNNWEGKVVVRMVIGANGMIASIQVTSSSGHEILDKQAQDMIQKAKGRVQIPAGLRGRDFPVEIPVLYNLKEDAG